jgi:hypothetical protein
LIFVAIPVEIAKAFQHPGPFATVYLDATRSDEHGAAEVQLRWRDFRRELLEAGALARALDAIEPAVGAHHEVAGPHGQVLVASADGVLRLDAVLPAPPLQPLARWAPLPHLVPYLAQRAPDIAYVLVVADHSGADLYAVPADAEAEGRTGEHEVVHGTVTYPLHKTPGSDWSAAHFQRRVENAWAENAHDVAAEAAAAASRVSAALVVLAGEERARALIATALAQRLPPESEVEQVAHGGRAAGSSQQALTEGVQDAVLRSAWRRRRALLDRLTEQLGRGDRAVAGVNAVVAALQRAQAETVVLARDPSSDLDAWIGPEPAQIARVEAELIELGVQHPMQDRFDAALLRALAASGADLYLTPGPHEFVAGGIAAILRYSDEVTTR